MNIGTFAQAEGFTKSSNGTLSHVLNGTQGYSTVYVRFNYGASIDPGARDIFAVDDIRIYGTLKNSTSTTLASTTGSEAPSIPVITNSVTRGSSSTTTIIVAIAGGVGGLVLIVIAVVVALVIKRRKSAPKQETQVEMNAVSHKVVHSVQVLEKIGGGNFGMH